MSDKKTVVGPTRKVDGLAQWNEFWSTPKGVCVVL